MKMINKDELPNSEEIAIKQEEYLMIIVHKTTV